VASHAEGYYTTSSGNYSHAEGSITTAKGAFSHAEGYNTLSSGSNSHAEGIETLSSGDNSHAEGANTTSSGWYTHAEGGYTEATGIGTHAEGIWSRAESLYSHAGGLQVTSSIPVQTAFGQFNNSSYSNNEIFVIGYGADASSRADALQVRGGTGEVIIPKKNNNNINGPGLYFGPPGPGGFRIVHDTGVLHIQKWNGTQYTTIYTFS